MHGDVNTYKNQGCRCEACRKAAVAYQRRYKERRRSEGPLTEPAGEAREHLRRLAASGVSLNQVARLTGLAASSLRSIEKGRTTRLRRDTVEAIEAIQLGTTSEALRVPGSKARRLVDAMAAAGISRARLARALRCEHPGDLRFSRREYVTRRSWDRLVTLYRHYARRGLVPADVLEEVGE